MLLLWGLQVGLKLKSSLQAAKDRFFDTDYVKDRIGVMRAKALMRIGGFIRTTARRSMRPRKAPSIPGQPPHTHTSDNVASLKNILFALEPSTNNVVVGPVLLNMVTQASVAGGKGFTWQGTIPELHEHGGDAVIREFQFESAERYPQGNPAKTWWRMDLRFDRSYYSGQRAKPQRRRKAHYPARPFMRPALGIAQDASKLAAAWEYALRP